jgi:predicted kinase
VSSASRPRLVIVSGAPGTGKTTLAQIIAPRLGLPLFARDKIKERLDDTFRLAPETAGLIIDSSALGRASYAMLFDVVDALATVGMGAVIESNFRRGSSEPDLRPLVAATSAVLVHCNLTNDAVFARFVGRAGSPDRHPVHPDFDRLPALRDDLWAGRFEPLDLSIPTLRVDTADGYDPSIDEIIGFVRDPGAV